MIPKTQEQLRAMVRFYTDKGSDTTRFPDADIDIYLDIGLQCYHAALVRTMNWVEVKTHEFTSTALDSYTVPLHYKTVGVDVKRGEEWFPVRRANMFKSGHVWTMDDDVRGQYSEAIVNDSQTLFLHRRTATAGTTYRLRYIAPSRTVTGEPVPDDQYLFPNGWEEIPCLEAAKRLMAKDKEDDTQIRALLVEAYARMDAEASTADIFQRPDLPGVFDLELDKDRHGG